jgi:hypothetical protein
MRPLDKSEAAIDKVVSSSKRLIHRTGGPIVMEYSEGGGNKDGQQPHHPHRAAAPAAAGGYVLPPESRQQQQPQHRLQQQIASWPPQPQQQALPHSQLHPIYAQHPQQVASTAASAGYVGRAYPQQDLMSAASTGLEHHPGAIPGAEYAHLSAAAVVAAQQQQQQQQYLRHHHASAVGGPSSYAAPGYNPRQYAQLPPASYQQQLALHQSMMGAPQQPLLHHGIHPGLDPSTQPQPHPSLLQQLQLQQQQLQQQPYLQPKVGRLPSDRPLIKLSVSLIDTYKQINTVYYEERDARRAARAKEKAQKGQGTNNNGWDDENYDYIVTSGELFYGRYRIKERIGKGSFGQVVRAEDLESQRDVAIKIIKSKKPFLMQAKTEIELLSHLNDRDPEDQHNIGTFWVPLSESCWRGVLVGHPR